MTFDVAADAYGAFMGRYSRPLAATFADLLDVAPGRRALDVGCGPGALAAELVDRGAQVCAVDPSAPFVEAVRAALPAVQVAQAPAEELPHPDGSFDVVAAQLVVHFMTDPVAGLAEMARVARPGAVVAANVWDFAGARAPLSPYWTAATALDPSVTDESHLAGAADGALVALFAQAGMAGARQEELSVRVELSGFADYWEPFTYGVGPAGSHLAALDPPHREALRERCAQELPDGPFTLEALAWTATWRCPA